MSNVIVGKNRAPYGMSMKNSAGADGLNNRDVQQRFGGRLAARGLHDFAFGVDFENVSGESRLLSSELAVIAIRSGSRLMTALKFPLVPRAQPRR